MPIRVTCPSCGRSGRVPDHAAGRRIQCPACSYRYELAPPAAASPAPPADLELLDDDPPPRPAARPAPRPTPPAAAPRPARPQPARPADDFDPYEAPSAPAPWRAQPPRAAAPAGTASKTGLYVGIAAAALVGSVAYGIAYDFTNKWARGKLGGAPAQAGVAGPAAPGGFGTTAPVSGPGVTAEPGYAAQARAAAAAPARDDGPARPLSTADIVAESDPSIALIKGNASSGTGFLVGPGLLATNSHVIDDEFLSQLQVHFPSADAAHAGPVAAELLYEDPRRDLALLAVPTDLRPLRVAASYTFRKGEDVTVIGSPGIGDGKVLANAVSRGVMSTQTSLDGQNFYQLGIAVNPGNSGGPVFDSAGRVIGVVTLKTSEQEALAFCVPVEDLRAALAALAGQTAADAAKVRSRHRIVHAVKGLGVAGAVYCGVIDACRKATAGLLDPDEMEKFTKLDGVLGEIDRTLFAAIPPEVPAIENDPLVVAPVRAQVVEMAANYDRLKSAYAQRRGAIPANEVRQFKQTHRRLVVELAQALGLETPTKMLTAFDDREGSGPPPSAVMGGAMPPSMEQFRERMFGARGLRPPTIPRPPSFGGPRAPFGPRGQLNPRFGTRR